MALAEAYASPNATAHFDHAAFDAVLKRAVDAEGFVDYEALNADPAPLDAYLAALAEAPFDALSRDEKLALLINAYNAFTLKLMVERWPLTSIQNIPEDHRWDDRRWRIGGRTLSLNEIEHGELRRKFREPRVHFAINCASVGCPPLRTEAYSGERLDAQLEDQARRVHTDPRWFRFAPGGPVALTRIYLWYRGDFEQVAGGVLSFAAHYSPELAAALKGGAPPGVRWLGYDWSVNSRENVPRG